MEYNTARSIMGMREYGRHVQRMVDHLMTIEDRAKRQEQAQVVIELMGFLNPQLKNIEDYKHKLWDHLFFMSNFKLEVDSPYPIPTKETYKQKPDPLPYPKRKIKYAHLGKNLELVIDKAMVEKDEVKKELKNLFKPIVSLILEEIYPYIYLSLLLVIISFFLVLGIFIMLIKSYK